MGVPMTLFSSGISRRIYSLYTHTCLFTYLDIHLSIYSRPMMCLNLGLLTPKFDSVTLQFLESDM